MRRSPRPERQKQSLPAPCNETMRPAEMSADGTKPDVSIILSFFTCGHLMPRGGNPWRWRNDELSSGVAPRHIVCNRNECYRLQKTGLNDPYGDQAAGEASVMAWTDLLSLHLPPHFKLEVGEGERIVNRIHRGGGRELVLCCWGSESGQTYVSARYE